MSAISVDESKSTISTTTQNNVGQSKNLSNENNDLQDNATTNTCKKEGCFDGSSVANTVPPKKKNAQKREKLKKLQMPAQNVNVQTMLQNDIHTPSTSCLQSEIKNNQEIIVNGDEAHIQSKNPTTPTKMTGNLKNLHISSQQSGQQTLPQLHAQGTSSVHDFFLQQVIPLYPTPNTRYLENLAHHPHFQLTQNVNSTQIYQNYRHPLSAPNSPLIYRNQSGCSSNPNSPYQQSLPHSPKYLQNLLQHPLLSQSVTSGHHLNNVCRNIFLGAPNAQHVLNCDNIKILSPNKKGNNNKKEDDKKFEPYISKEEVESGLLSNTLIEGVVRINPKQFQHAYVSSTDRSEQDVLIDGVRNRNRALEGDVVIVQFVDSDSEETNDEMKQKKGKVVYIKEKVHTRSCIGTLKLMPDKNRQRALFIPRDYRVPRLNVSCTYWPDNFYTDYKRYENTLFLAEIFDWFDTRFALGKIVCNLGESGNMQTETKAILLQTDLDISSFGPEVRYLFPSLDYIIPEEEIMLREDCRKLCIFSIDPYNCRDIDDAVSCRKLDNGNYEVGVHISDVSHFLTENTILDEKVSEKATTVYMVERAYHMLPDELCMLCSLFPGVDKLAFSVFWEITEDTEILKPRFAKTVIHSCCKLAYENAQAVLEDKDDAEDTFPEIYNNFKYSHIHESIKNLGKISAILRKRRFDGGALRIDQPKVSFNLSPTDGMPESIRVYESKESHQLIEEFMLLANMAVANKIYEDHPNLAFLRCHPEPSGYMLKQLAKSLKPMGIDLEITSAGDLYKSLLPHVSPSSQDKGKAMVLSMLCAKPMARAKYFCAGGSEEDFHHYALNVPLYTHFTSPIRRYADVMVHRLLSASLKYREVPKWEVEKVNMIASQCNKQKYNAKKAGELSTELYTIKYIEKHSPLITEAVVVEVREKFIDVIIVAMGFNSKIFFNNDFPGDFKCIKNEAGMKLSKMELTWHASGDLPKVQQTIAVFSTLQVEMHKGDDMAKIDIKLVRPEVEAPIL